MTGAPASTESLPHDGVPSRPSWRSSDACSLICSGSLQNKAVRFGSLEPAGMTLAKQTVLPFVVVVVLAACLRVTGDTLASGFYALSILVFVISAQIFSPLELRRNSTRSTRAYISRRALEWGFVVAVLAFVAASFKLTHVFSRDGMLAWFSLTPVALLSVEALSFPVLRFLVVDRTTAQRYIIIGVNEVGLELARRIEESDGYGEFCGFFDFRNEERLRVPPSDQITGNCKAADVANFVCTNLIDRVYLALPISTAPRIEELLKELRDTTASIYFVPNIFAFDLVQARCVAINGMPAFSICDSPLQGMSGLWKRGFDILLACLSLFLLWPVFLGIAIAILQSSPGPVLFKQRRYGLKGEEILVYKFRSMTVCEDGPIIAQASKHDPRITPVGSFLRRTSLDELPQVLNVLEGKMSFVGPRPHAVAHNEEYRKLINGYMIRHKVRPGITGWAQVNGLRGETSTVDAMRRRVQHDLDYLKNWSLWFDLKIIGRTAMTMFRDANAY
jgi:putative colanic acid biosysnthesis UDP-glucose lipid carrier transferase